MTTSWILQGFWFQRAEVENAFSISVTGTVRNVHITLYIGGGYYTIFLSLIILNNPDLDPFAMELIPEVADCVSERDIGYPESFLEYLDPRSALMGCVSFSTMRSRYSFLGLETAYFPIIVWALGQWMSGSSESAVALEELCLGLAWVRGVAYEELLTLFVDFRDRLESKLPPFNRVTEELFCILR